jgi:hypothetical protein
MGEPALTKDLTLTATPAEFDDGFVAALKGYREARAGLIEQAEVTKEVLQAAKEAAAKKAAAATTKASNRQPSLARSAEPDETVGRAGGVGAHGGRPRSALNPTCSAKRRTWPSKLKRSCSAIATTADVARCAG